MTTTAVNLRATVERTLDHDGRSVIAVDVFAEGIDLDRPRVYGWSFGAHSMPLARRLARAVEAGAVLALGGVARDVNGSTYLQSTARVLGRTMNADLRRLGY